MFSPKDFAPDSVKSRVVYQFTCASCGARYIGETNKDFNACVNEHLFWDKNSHIFKHLSASKGCKDNNLVPRVLSLPRESTLVTAGHATMHANPSRTEGGSST